MDETMTTWWSAIEVFPGSGRPDTVRVGQGLAPWLDETQREFLPWSTVVPNSAVRIGTAFSSEQEAIDAAWERIEEDEDGWLQWAR